MGQPHPPADNPQNGQLDKFALYRPRPVPVLWGIDLVKVAEDPDQKTLAKLTFMSWNGEHTTFWGLTPLDALVKDLRGVLRILSQRDGTIATPDKPTLILPPGVN